MEVMRLAMSSDRHHSMAFVWLSVQSLYVLPIKNKQQHIQSLLYLLA